MYAALVAAAGIFSYRAGIKRHFTETYLHVAANVVFVALLSGLGNEPAAGLYLAVLVALCIFAGYAGVRLRRLAFFAYGTLYGYAGISYQLMRGRTAAEVLTYVVVTGTVVVLLLVALARRFGRET